jgi:SAM-dependent methyltransferase
MFPLAFFNPNYERGACALDDLPLNSSGCSRKPTLTNSGQIFESSDVQNTAITLLTRPRRWLRTMNRSESDLDARNRSTLRTRSKNWLRTLIYPGLDLHTRNRASLCVFWKTGRRDVLDAGCGNGYFSWLAYQSGARVLAMSFDSEQIEKARGFLVRYRGADEARLQFAKSDLNNLRSMDRKFDEIICYETLEHIRHDKEVLTEFYRILSTDGVLHLCCPYPKHPYHQASDLDLNEAGGHVRAGYTKEDYVALLKPIGYQIDTFVGIGSPGLCYADTLLRAVRHRLGDWWALPLFPFVLPFVWLSKFNPSVPFSLYVRAIKPPAVSKTLAS